VPTPRPVEGPVRIAIVGLGQIAEHAMAFYRGEVPEALMDGARPATCWRPCWRRSNRIASATPSMWDH
jgi:hypothetical protein